MGNAHLGAEHSNEFLHNEYYSDNDDDDVAGDVRIP